MLQEFVARFDDRRAELQSEFERKHPEDYDDIVQRVVRHLSREDEYENPDPSRIHCIDDGDYQGTKLFVIGADNYQPDRYWCVRISYGSCSACDTFERIRGYSQERPTEDQVREYMTLALHVVQELREI